MQRAIAAEAALSAAVVAGEVDLTAIDPNEEEAQPAQTAADATGNGNSHHGGLLAGAGANGAVNGSADAAAESEVSPATL